MNRGAPGRLHGDDLIGEVLRNMEEGLFRIRRKTIVPAIYRIYLSPQDYEPFRDVATFIAGEIRTALDEQLASWNRSRRKFGSGLLEKIGAGEAGRAPSMSAWATPGRSKYIPIWTANYRPARLRFIQNWARRRRRNMARDR